MALRAALRERGWDREAVETALLGDAPQAVVGLAQRALQAARVVGPGRLVMVAPIWSRRYTMVYIAR